MTSDKIREELEGLRSIDRLIGAMLGLWEERGNAGLSARSLGQAAGLPVSSIYHHFGSMERLYESAQDHARKAAERWCAERLDAITGADGLSPAALPAIMAAAIDDWAYGQRRLAFAWRECQLLAARDPHHLAAHRGWQALWRDFWGEMCRRCGAAEAGEATAILFGGESVLHLMQWRRLVDRAGLDETCRGWGIWIGGSLAPEGPWRRFARIEAVRSMPELALHAETAARIAMAAAETVEELGMAGLTHRAVAARAGLTLGVVSYNFRTSADLARAAFEMIYRRVASNVVAPPESDPASLPDADAAFDRMTGYDILAPRLAALDEMMVAVARDPDLRPFAPQLRYLRGRSSGVQLQVLVGADRPISPADAALVSAFSGGQRFACLGLPPEEVGPFLRRTLGDLLALVGAGAGARNR